MSCTRTASGVLLLSAMFGTALPSGQSQTSPPPTTGPAAVASAPILDIPYEKFVLANGLTVLVHEDHKAPIVAVNVWYHVGSKNEKSGRTGFAHLFEHLMFKPDHTTLVAVGDVTMAELTPKLERAFAAWKPGEVPTKNIAPVPGPASAQLYLLDRPGAEQSVILVGAVAPPKANPDEHAYMAFNDAFGGSFSGRINMNLREDKHWAYGAGSFAFDARGQRPWIIWAPVQTDKTKESVQEVLKELREVTTTRPLSAEELDAAKDRMTRSLAGRWETGSAVSGAIEETVTFGLPDDYHASFAQRVRAVTPEAVAAAVGKAVSAQRIAIVVVGDRAVVEPGLKELGIGVLRRLDGDGQPIPEGPQP